MIQQLVTTDIQTFDRQALKSLRAYFDLNLATCSQDLRNLWFQNLFVLAQHNLSIAHCVQHNHYPRLHVEVKFRNGSYPSFYDPVYENQIGCFSNCKSADTMRLDGTEITGTKHWISLVDRADFGIFRVPCGDTEALVLIDFNAVQPKIDMDFTTPIGMEIARPGSITIDKFCLPPEYILDYKKYHENSSEFFHITNISDYCFITNYVGLLVALFRDLENYVRTNSVEIQFELKKIALKISAICMTWQDNLESTKITTPTDEFWNRRNTQYTLGKETLLELINLILQIGDSRWLDAKSPNNQRFRDALVFSSHMKPLYKNLAEQHFFRF